MHLRFLACTFAATLHLREWSVQVGLTPIAGRASSGPAQAAGHGQARRPRRRPPVCAAARRDARELRADGRARAGVLTRGGHAFLRHGISVARTHSRAGRDRTCLQPWGPPPPPRGSPLQNYTWLINMLYKIYINQTEGCVTRSVRASSGRTARAPPGRPLPSTSRTLDRRVPCVPAATLPVALPGPGAIRARPCAPRILQTGQRRARGEGPPHDPSPRVVSAGRGRLARCTQRPAVVGTAGFTPRSGGHCLLDSGAY